MKALAAWLCFSPCADFQEASQELSRMEHERLPVIQAKNEPCTVTKTVRLIEGEEGEPAYWSAQIHVWVCIEEA